MATAFHPVVNLINEWAGDYSLWSSECVFFKAKDGKVFLHDHPNAGQLKLRKPRSRQRVILKARQVGASSEIAAQFVHDCLFTPGTSIAVVAQTAKGVRGISDLYAHIVSHLPAPLRTGVFKAVIGVERIHWPSLNSDIVFGTANSDSFRGTPRQGCHATECAFFQNLAKFIEALRPTIHGPLVLESTANGAGDFHFMWNDPHMETIFIGWRDDPTCVSEQPLPTDLTPQEVAYIRLHQLSKEQASWFVYELRNTTWDGWKQEHPQTPDEAFVLGGDRFFSQSFFPAPTANIPILQVHAKPIRGHRYAIGADPASGSKTGDRSAAVVLDVTDPFAITTAASYANRIAPSQFGSAIAKLSKTYYDAIVCVERNAGWGLAVLDNLRTSRVPLYRSKVFDQTKKSYEDVYGFNTSATTRPLLLAQFQELVNSQHYIPKDARIEEEANAFRYGETGKPCAVAGCHDDLIFAAALAFQAASQARDSALPPPPPPELPINASIEETLQWEMQTGMLVADDESYDED